tara:strand:- start:261 stop:1646 length:1386 start_codon:yes stop_codon:yes gene_type:complete
MAANKEDKQMIMAFMVDDGKDVDPVSGNDVPPGSLAKEVRDDIPAQLSEGEYVVPADVLRFYGMKFFEDLRENAKIELARMESEGRIGGEPVKSAVGGYITDQPTQTTAPDPYQQQRTMYRQGAPVARGNASYNKGGVQLSAFGNPINTALLQGSYNSQQGGPEIKDGVVYMPSSTYYVGSSLFGAAPSLQPAFTPVTLYGPNGEIVTANTQAEYDDYVNNKNYKETQTVTPVEEETKPETKDPVSSELMKKVFGEEKKEEPVNFTDEKSIKDAIGDYHSSGPLKVSLLTGAINPALGLLTYFKGSESQDEQKDYLLKGINERISSSEDPPEKARLEKLRQELLDKDTYEASINEKSKELGLFDGFLDKLKGSLTNEDIEVVKAKYNNSSEAASDAWQNATNLKNSLHPRDDPIAYHNAVKAQSEASRAFTALKRAETGYGTDDYTPSPAPEPTVFNSNQD